MGPILASLLTLAAAAPVQPSGGAAQTRFEGMFTDWRSANSQSIEAERQGLQRPPAQASAGPGPSPGSAALGERVGEIVALGDCAEGERIARAAGDFALVAAVRQHCSAADPRP